MANDEGFENFTTPTLSELFADTNIVQEIQTRELEVGDTDCSSVAMASESTDTES